MYNLSAFFIIFQRKYVKFVTFYYFFKEFSKIKNENLIYSFNSVKILTLFDNFLIFKRKL